MSFIMMVLVITAGWIIPEPQGSDNFNEIRVFKLLEAFDYNTIDHFPDTEIFGVSAKRGEALVKEGFSSRPGGGRTKKQSKHFVCTSCHNVEREDPDLRFADPEARLIYTNKKGLPFLQATSLYGAVNRESFYNGDYYKKYGELVIPARDNIREAIQLCAIECAQGRKLLPWELESILAYLWTIDLKLSDLNLSDEEQEFVENAYRNRTRQDSAAMLVSSRYRKDSPASFGDAFESMQEAEEIKGNPENGKLVYENSCLHCHEDRRYSYFLLDNEDLTFEHLAKKSDGFSKHSIFQVIRYGVFSKAGKRSYMPQYPLEKMSDQQLADLEAYIEMRAAE